MAEQRRGSNRRLRLLDAAISLFAARGFQNTSIDDIGTIAGITGPGIYRHFPSKQSILDAIFRDVMEELLDNANRLVNGPGSPERNLVNLVKFHTRFVLNEKQRIQVVETEYGSISAAEKASYSKQRTRYTQVWEEALSKCKPGLEFRDVEVMVWACLGLINSFSRYRSSEPSTAIGDRVAQAALRILILGISDTKT